MRSQGTAGTATLFNCVRCFTKQDIVNKKAELRTPKKISEIVTLCQINPQRHKTLFGLKELYTSAKGCKHCSISPENPEFLSVDELHLDINFAQRFEKAAITIITVNISGKLDKKDSLKWTIKGEEKEEATRRWAANTRKVTGFIGSAKNLASNPGNHARAVLNKTLRDELFSIVPESVSKNNLLKALELFDKLRDVIKTRIPSEGQKNSYEDNAKHFHNYMENEMKWIPKTNLLHILLVHVSIINNNL